MSAQYRIEWAFANGSRYVILARFPDEGAANRAARADEWTRPVFAAPGMAQRTASAFEYMDRFPVPVDVRVSPVRR